MKRFCNLVSVSLTIPLLAACFICCSPRNGPTQPDKQQISQASAALLAAQNGDADAQNTIGNCYYKGVGVAKTFNQAIYWYRKSAAQGYAPAQHNLGWMFARGEGVAQDYHEALTWYLKSAEQGFPNAQQKVGYSYSSGLGVVKDNVEAMKWYRRAAEQGDVVAQHSIGYSYENGLGMPRNYEEAFIWYLKAAQQGFPKSQFAVGEFYRTGYGIEKDDVEAYKWYVLAATQIDEDGFNKQPAAARDQLSAQLTPLQIKDAQQRAKAFVPVTPKSEPPTESTEVVILDDKSKRFAVQIRRILLGQRVVDEGRFDQYQRNALHKQKKEVVYFEVSVANLSGPQEASLNASDFTLEDSQGNTYSCEVTTDWITGKLHWGKTGRGGIAFAVYYDSTPQKLLYNTSLVDSFTGEKLFAAAASLDKLTIFKEPIARHSQ
jgi:TPR repeat protein